MESAKTRLLIESLEPRLVAGSYLGFQPSGKFSAFWTGILAEDKVYFSTDHALRQSSQVEIQRDENEGAGRIMDQIGSTDSLAQNLRLVTDESASAPFVRNNPDNTAALWTGMTELEQALNLQIQNRNSRAALPQRWESTTPYDANHAVTSGGEVTRAENQNNYHESILGSGVSFTAPMDTFPQQLIVANFNPNLNGAGLIIPTEHPRLWWTPERLQQSRDWYHQNPFTPRDGNAWENVFVYMVTGDLQYGRAAVQMLMNFTISEQELAGVASDNYRWADWVAPVYDWTYDLMTPSQRQTFTDRYNRYVDILSHHDFGGPGYESNNYYWGYLRNELSWGIATYYENPMAQTFIDHALITRWQDGFLPYAQDGGRGGVSGEGTLYGPYLLAYPTVPFVTANLLGRDLYSETNYFKEAVFNLIYSTSPDVTYRKDGPTPYYQVFPFGDDDNFGGYPAAGNSYLGDFMSTMVNTYPDLPVGMYARQWMIQTDPDMDPYVNALDNRTGPTLDFSNLPVDYYAPGSGYFYTRSQWGTNATSVFLQLGQTYAAGHQHLDMGTFQIIRNQNYVAKESTGYVNQFADENSNDTLAHNSIVFNGYGEAPAYAIGPARIVRLQSADNFSYAAVDLTGAYRSSRQQEDNPYVRHIIREFIFVKPLETMLVLDRLESSSEQIPAEDVQKTFVLHFPQEPKIDGPNTVLAENGDQALRLITLGSSPDYSVTDEGDFEGPHSESSFYQFRLNATLTGRAQDYFINVLQARGVNEEDVAAKITDDGSSWTISLTHPTKGNARIVLNKGMVSAGGEVGYSPKGDPKDMTPLLDHVQSIRVTDSGPYWGS
jgi:hypothetical protein